MKLNKLILVSIVLLTLISLGAASAASDNVTADDLQIGGGKLMKWKFQAPPMTK